MEKGHYGDYTGNSRHSRKEEMIHDRELISDAKKQLHSADKDYKQDSPAKRALVGDQDKLPEEVKQAIYDAPTNYGTPLENSGLGPKTAGSGLYMRACGYKK